MRARKSFARAGHGKGAGQPHIEVPPIDELSTGIPAETAGNTIAATAAALASVQRSPDGRVVDAASASAMGRLGGLARAERDRKLAAAPRLVRGLGLRDVSAEHLVLYLDDATEFATAECARLAEVVGGGQCGNAPASMVSSAALQLAGSRCAFARGELQLGSRLANDSRQNLLAAHELCAREAQARQSQQGDGLAVAQRAFQQRLAQQAEQRQRLIDAPACADDSDDDAADQDALSGRTGAGT